MRNRILAILFPVLLPLSLQAATSDLTVIELRTGANAIGFPIAGDGSTTSFELLQLLGDRTEIARLRTLNPLTGDFLVTFYDASGNPVGDNVPVRFGDGMLVDAIQSTTVAVPEAATCRALSLEAGVNLISLPCAAPGLRAFDLLRTLGGEPGIVTLERLDGTSARFEAASSGAEPQGSNFLITAGEALFVHTQAALEQWDVQLVGPDGGTFEFANGMTLEVPAGALTESVAITLSDLECGSVEPLLDSPVLSTLEKSCIRAFEALPEGLEFLQPATVSFPASVQAPEQVPLSLLLNEDGSAYDIEDTSLALAEGVLSIQIEHFSKRTAAEGKFKIQVEGDPLPPECFEVPTPPGACCTTYSVQSIAGDAAVVGDRCGNCQIVGEQIDIVFPTCDGAPEWQLLASETSGECPADLAMVISPPDATLWTCQSQDIEVLLTGTNPDSGLACTFNAPARWVRPPGSTTNFSFEQGPINTGTLRATSPGRGILRAINAADPFFTTDFVVDFESLGGTWTNAFLAGSERCVLDGEEFTIEDDGPEFFDVNIAHSCDATTNSISITSVDLPEAEAFVGPLTETGNPNEPFVFDSVGYVNSSESADCQVLTESGGTEIIFGDTPLCDSEGNACEITSCTQTDLLQGSVSNAIAAIISGNNSFQFDATWDELVPSQGGGFTREAHSISCSDQGDIVFQANKQ